jgi:LPS O-antigen subunit length determinant protein (WzzB/FepE family)
MLQTLLKKRDKLQTLYKKYPEFSKMENRQVVELGHTGDRYLSLLAQIIGVESRIVDLEQMKECFEIEKKKSELYCAFFSELKKKLEQHHNSGEQVFKEIEMVKENLFKGRKSDALETRAVHNSITIELSRFNILFYKSLRFVSGPSLPDAPEWPKKSIFIIFGFFIGSLIFIFTALILEFWSKHKQLIKSDK